MYRKIIKRSLSNMRDSYLIYILACSFAIGIFGILLSMGDNPSVHSALSWWDDFIYDITTIMSSIFAFFAFIYMIYVGGFFVKQQRNEFLTFEKLGMPRWAIITISFLQTAIVQAVAWVIGLSVMLVFQKFMGMLLFYLMQIRFNFVMHIGLKSFGLLVDVFLISTLVLSLINAIKTMRILQKRQRRTIIKTRWWLRIPAGIFGVILLLTAQIVTLYLFKDMRIISYSSKPLTEIVYIMGADIFGTYLVYFGFLPTILNIMERIHSVSYSGINLFSFKYMKERLFQNISILWFVTELSALALALLTFCYFGYQAVHQNYNSAYPFELAANKDTVKVIRKELKKNHAQIKGSYKTAVKINLVSYYSKSSQSYIRQPMTFMSYSDYESLPKRMHKNNAKINSHEFLKIDYNSSLMYNSDIDEHNIEVKGAPMIRTAEQGNSFPYGSSMHFGPMMIVPDNYYEKMPSEVKDTFYGWDFKKGDRLKHSQMKKLENYRDAYYMKVEFESSLSKSTIEVMKKEPNKYEAATYTQAGFLRQGNLKKHFKQGGGFYLFIVALFSVALLVALGSVLTLRILLRDDYQSSQLRTLQKIGVEESEIKGIIRCENTLTFLIPIVFALIQSFAAIAMFDFGRHISKNIILIYAGYIVLYGLFGIISFKVSWRGIKQKFKL
ncbi:FtsX-like permease family protein [Companilactobacillus huachuanensis]|uniref:FtsX-like permease family protein n=1 Tax=Companilactobacillus huachuanensis TaxID=2559914 RepID=A0ABW1RMR4_9LACO|nr:FtsX-like permease family protein [Companilactobacillus huachuanensis]